MADPKIIDSPLSRIVEEDGISVDVRICRLEDTEWSLEIVANYGMTSFRLTKTPLPRRLSQLGKMESEASPKAPPMRRCTRMPPDQ